MLEVTVRDILLKEELIYISSDDDGQCPCTSHAQNAAMLSKRHNGKKKRLKDNRR